MPRGSLETTFLYFMLKPIPFVFLKFFQLLGNTFGSLKVTSAVLRLQMENIMVLLVSGSIYKPCFFPTLLDENNELAMG